MLKRLFIPLAIASMLATSASAGYDDADWNPPAKYEQGFPASLSILAIAPAAVNKKCKALAVAYGWPASAEYKGCSQGDAKKCVVWIANQPIGPTSPAAVLRHELGHCMGWPANHPSN